jgi:hypothetical protein
MLNKTPNNKIIKKRKKGKMTNIKVPFISKTDFFNFYEGKKEIIFNPGSEISH